MRHWVFGCSSKYKDKIDMAKKAMNFLSLAWMLEHDCVMCAYHSTFSIQESQYNTEIALENENVTQLIDDAMAFARELEYLKIKGGCAVANVHPGELAQGHDKETKTHDSSYGPTSEGEKNDCQ